MDVRSQSSNSPDNARSQDKENNWPCLISDMLPNEQLNHFHRRQNYTAAAGMQLLYLKLIGFSIMMRLVFQNWISESPNCSELLVRLEINRARGMNHGMGRSLVRSKDPQVCWDITTCKQELGFVESQCLLKMEFFRRENWLLLIPASVSLSNALHFHENVDCDLCRLEQKSNTNFFFFF